MAVTAYAALVSLMHLVKRILHSSVGCISDKREQIISLDDKVCSLVNLLEDLSNRRSSNKFLTDELKNQLANTCHDAVDVIDFLMAKIIRANEYADELARCESHTRELGTRFCEDINAGRQEEAEDTIGSYVAYMSQVFKSYADNEVANRIRELSTRFCEDKFAGHDQAHDVVIDSFLQDVIRATGITDESAVVESRKRKLSMSFNENIKMVIDDMDLMNRKLIRIQKEMDHVKKDDHHQSINSSSTDDDGALSRRAPSSSGKDVMVGFEDHLDKMTSRLATTESKLQIFPIVGMPGIGKTTLAKNIYEKPIIVDYFHVRAWVTLSQTYTIREILSALLNDAQSIYNGEKQEIPEHLTTEQLGENLHKRLFGRSYLIIIDDIWSTKPWDELKRFFPDNRNGSRILITTRLSNVAFCFGSDNSLELNFLDEDKSWNLFCEKIFPGENFPLELEGIGRKIVENCRGLPLSIAVIGGLLAKSRKTPEYWEYVAQNLNSIINSDDDDYCLKLLSLSYSDLPIHLKPCFLYMAMFPEDCEIKISRLIKLWVAEGFLKPINDKSMEDAAMVYLEDLLNRNLVLVSKQEKRGQRKTCKIHDILRDLCIREAHKENFLFVTRVPYSLDNIPEGIESKRRLAIHQSGEPSYSPQIFNTLQSASSARSLVCEFEWNSPSLAPDLDLLRVLDVVDKYTPEEITKLSCPRYLAFKLDTTDDDFNFGKLLSSAHVRFNLQTFKCQNVYGGLLPPVIWEMTEARHLEFHGTHLPDPPKSDINGTQSCYILENLQTLAEVIDFRCTEEVVKRVPNLRKLKLFYSTPPSGMEWSYYCLNNLVRLHKLESLFLAMQDKVPVTNFDLPCSLKRLRLIGCRLPWEDIKVVGSLPQLEVLELAHYAFDGPTWDATATEEGESEFVRLKYLAIQEAGFKYWTGEKIHFPMLEFLLLSCQELEEIPTGLVQIPTLQKIHLRKWTPSVITLARKILEERDDLGYEGLQVYSYDKDEEWWCRVEINED